MQNVFETAKQHNQEHVFRFYDELTDAEKKNLTEQVGNVDYSKLAITDGVKVESGTITPIDILKIDDIDKNRARFEEKGRQVLADGKVAELILAGGQGSRLGFNKSKGMFNVGITRTLYLFEILVANTKKIADSVGRPIYIFIMTSPQNNDEIIEFFEENNYFGYGKDYVKFYIQTTLPSVDFNGKLMMKSKSELCLSPDGNGNFFNSLKATDNWKIIKESGAEWLNVFSIDNVLQQTSDPVFVGATVESGFNCGAKVIKKAYPEEKMGAICLKNGKPTVIEYYELYNNPDIPKEDSAYDYGVTLNYLFKVSELDKLGGDVIPIHLAKKFIKCIDEDGNPVTAGDPNGYKFEYLITDLIELSDTCLPFEVVREKEFAPIKNKTGLDSVDTARELLRLNGYEL